VFPKKNATLISQTRDTPNLIEKCSSLQFVPYRAGSSDIMKDLVGGHIDLTFDQAISALPHVRSGEVKAYAVTAGARLAAAPDIPTMDEAGAPGFRRGLACGCRRAHRRK
jgi:tripartite-type tricarboxylate transporter receptor subunit TctC